MAHRSVVQSDRAPKPIGPYVQAVHVRQPGPMLFLSGQIPIDPATGEIPFGDIKKQAEISFANVRAIVEEAGFSLGDLVKVSVFLTDLSDFETVNSVYAEFFEGASLPARAVIQVAALPKGVAIEVEGVAIKAGGAQA